MLHGYAVSSAFHFNDIVKSSTGLPGWDYGRHHSLLQLTLCDRIWQVTLSRSEMG